MVKFMQAQYPPGTRIRLNSMHDPYAPVTPGTEGVVELVDDAGSIHMKWNNGRTLAIIPGEDSFTVLPPKLETLKLYMPLTAEFYEPNEYGDLDENGVTLEGEELRGYESQIAAALNKYRMPEEAERGVMHWYYKNRPRQHNPLSQQKEFRAIKNAIIQEAERLRQQMEQARTASEQKPSQEEEPSSEETSTGASANPTLADENTSSAPSRSVRLPSEYLLNSTIRLFHQMGQIFRDNAAPPSNPMGIRVDSKRRKKLMQKRLAMGHKQDDHEQNYGQTLQ